MKQHKNGDIEFTLPEVESLMGGDTQICSDCGTMHPLPLWAFRKKMFCPSCKNYTTEGNAIAREIV